MSRERKRERKSEADRTDYRRFLVRFSLSALALYIAASLLPDSVYEPINGLTAAHTGMMLGAFGLQSVVRGEYLTAGGFPVRIIPECTPVFMILLFGSFVFSFPAAAKDRMKGLLFGVPFLIAANILRLCLTIAVCAARPSWFTYLHVYLGQIWSILVVLGACLAWVRWCAGTGKPAAIGRFLLLFAAAASVLFIAWLPLNRGYVMACDGLLRFLFSLLGTRLVFTYDHVIYYHTVNLVVLGALILADDGMKWAAKTRGLFIGAAVLMPVHIMFRVHNVFLTAFGLTASLPVATAIHLTAQFLLPLILWLAMGGGKSIRRHLIQVRSAAAQAAIPCIAALAFLGALALAQPPSASAQALLIDEAAILRDFNEGRAKTYVIVNLADPGHEDLTQPEGRVLRRQRVRWMQNRVFSRVSGLRVKLTNRFDYHAGFAAEVTREGLEELRRQGDVVSIEKDRKLQIHTRQGISLLHASDVRNTYNGQGVAIAIVDTGIDYTHSKLGGGGFPNAKVLGGYDFGGSADDPLFQDADPMDANGHGTSCAGIAAGQTGTTGDYIGGVAHGAKLYAVKVTHGSGGEGYTSDIVAGWEWCVTHKNDNPAWPIKVISTSMGDGRHGAACNGESTALTAAAANAVAAGITLFGSAGNDGYCDGIAWPGCISHVIAVGAVFDASLGNMGFCVKPESCAPNQGTHATCSPNPIAWTYSTPPDREAPYSNTAAILGLFAPSHNAYTSAKGGGYVSNFGGTSAASPYAAGAAAALQSAAMAQLGRFLTPAEVRSILVNTGDRISDVKFDYGKNRINLDAAVHALTAEPAPALDSMGLLALALGAMAVYRISRNGAKKKRRSIT